jgi:L-lactate dehydrogenase (cytochrome)
MKAASPLDYRALAKARLPRFLFEYYDGGSYAEVTLRRNIADLEAVALRQRVLHDVSAIDLTTELFGRTMTMPIALAPIGLAGMGARRGEVQAARAAEAAGIPFCLSTVSACPIAEVARGLTKPFWFQLYMIRDRAFMKDLLTQAREAGCDALVFTLPRLSVRPCRRARLQRRCATCVPGDVKARLGVGRGREWATSSAWQRRAGARR